MEGKVTKPLNQPLSDASATPPHTQEHFPSVSYNNGPETQKVISFIPTSEGSTITFIIQKSILNTQRKGKKDL